MASLSAPTPSFYSRTLPKILSFSCVLAPWCVAGQVGPQYFYKADLKDLEQGKDVVIPKKDVPVESLCSCFRLRGFKTCVNPEHYVQFVNAKGPMARNGPGSKRYGGKGIVGKIFYSEEMGEQGRGLLCVDG